MTEKFNFDITPEFFQRINIYPYAPFQVSLLFLNYETYNDYIPKKIEENYQKIDPKYLSKLPFKYQDKFNKVKDRMKNKPRIFQ